MQRSSNTIYGCQPGTGGPGEPEWPPVVDILRNRSLGRMRVGIDGGADGGGQRQVLWADRGAASAPVALLGVAIVKDFLIPLGRTMEEKARVQATGAGIGTAQAISAQGCRCRQARASGQTRWRAVVEQDQRGSWREYTRVRVFVPVAAAVSSLMTAANRFCYYVVTH